MENLWRSSKNMTFEISGKSNTVPFCAGKKHRSLSCSGIASVSTSPGLCPLDSGIFC